MYCQGVQVYSKKKEAKMILIVGEAMQKLSSCDQTSWEPFAAQLSRVGLEKETLDCAFVYCLRLSGNLSDVNKESLKEFIEECNSRTFSYT